MASFEWPPSGGTTIALYANFAAFPAASTSPNSFAFDENADNLYFSNGTSWILIAGAGGVFSIGAYGSTPNAAGGSISGGTLTLQPASASYPGGVTISSQTFAGSKTFSSQLLFADGNNTAPGIALATDTGSGLYKSGTNKIALACHGIQTLDTGLSASSLGNVGIGVSASASDSYPLLIQRDITSAGVYMQISNTDTAASSKATYQLAADAGNNNGEISLFTSATSTAAYANAMTVRPSGSTGKLSLIGGDLSTGYVTTYTGGDYTSTGETIRFNADHTNQLMQSVAAPTSPASGLKYYNNSDVFTTKTTGGTISSFAGSNTGDVTIGTANGLSLSGQALSLATASGSTTGALTSSDWTTFNGKQSALNFSSPLVNTAGTVALQGASGTAFVGSGGTGASTLSYTSGNTGSTIASRDSNGNTSFNAVNGTSTATATSGQTIAMNAGSAQTQKTTGTSTCTFKLPDATTLINGWIYWFNNNSTGTVTIQNNGAGAVTTVPGGGFAQLICTDNTTTNGVWDYHFEIPSNSSWGTSALTIGALSTAGLLRTTSGGVISSAELSGDITTSGSNAASAAATQNNITSIPNLATVGTVTSGTWNATAIAIAHGGTGQTSASAAFNALSPMTTGGDLIYGGASGAGTRLANGSAGQYLQSAGGTSAPTWATMPGNYYAQAYYPSSATNYWSLGSTSQGDFSVSGSIPSPSTYVNSNFGTISKATSSLPGINFSAPRTGVIRFTVTTAATTNASALSFTLFLLETTTSTTISSQAANFPSNQSVAVTLTGYFSATASTTYNFKLQGQGSASTTVFLDTQISTGAMMVWSMEYIT